MKRYVLLYAIRRIPYIKTVLQTSPPESLPKS
uniref:Uncharacterized protein n=1 Tax=Myoviridae sp. ctByu2 TaxID=2827668 RepID=A0A8S5S9Q0_9CAUD|nr:MAG TPA: hypothetical protein [Myoviridae sp. ctByu2]